MDIQTSTWSETAASNNAAPPNGMPEGQSATSINDGVREIMGAIKRAWNRDHAALTSGGTSTAVTLTYTTAPTYVQGIAFVFKVGTTTTAAATLNVNALGAKAIYRNGTTTGLILTAGQTVIAQYDITVDCFYVLTGDHEFDLAWTAYTPTATPGTGAFTALGTLTGRHRKIDGKTATFRASVPITTNGTAASYVDVSLPFTVLSGSDAAGAGWENNITADGLQVRLLGGGSVARCYYMDGSYPGASGALLILSGTCETA